MKTLCALFTLLIMIASSAFPQSKEQNRVANAGKVMKEILSIPKDSPRIVCGNFARGIEPRSGQWRQQKLVRKVCECTRHRVQQCGACAAGREGVARCAE